MSAPIGQLPSKPVSGPATTGQEPATRQTSPAFANLLGHLEGEDQWADKNWSASGRPVRAHVRRFDESSLLALSAALGSGVPVSGAGPVGTNGKVADTKVPSGQVVEVPEGHAFDPDPEREGHLTSSGTRMIFELKNGRALMSVPAPFQHMSSGATGLGPVDRVNIRGSAPPVFLSPDQTQTGKPAGQGVYAGISRAAPPFSELVQARNLASHPVQVAICALESGLRVVVKARGADIDDPAELQRAVSRVLAEYGHSGAEISMIGVSRNTTIGG